MERSRFLRALVAIAALSLVLAVSGAATPSPVRTGSFTQVGHEPLLNRGMNSALAVHGDYVYIGAAPTVATRTCRTAGS